MGDAGLVDPDPVVAPTPLQTPLVAAPPADVVIEPVSAGPDPVPTPEPAPVAPAATRPRSRALVADVVLAAALAVAVGVMFGPWLRSGSSRRTSFELVQAVDRLAVVPGTTGSVLRPIWSFVPFVATVALVFLALGRRRIAAALAVVVGALEAAFAGTVQQAPRSADWGVTAGLVAGPALIVIAVASAWLTRKQRVP